MKRLQEDAKRREHQWALLRQKARARFQPGPEASTAAAGPRLSREEVEGLAEPREAGVGDGRTDGPEELQAGSEPALQQQHGPALVPPPAVKEDGCCDEGNSSTHQSAVTGAGDNIAFPASPSSLSRVHACV